MGHPGLNTGQRVVVIVGLGVALSLFGSWLIGHWGFGGSTNSFGWVGYAPLSHTISWPGRILHPWVRLVIWLALTMIWVAASAFLLRSRTTDLDVGPSRAPGDHEEPGSAS